MVATLHHATDWAAHHLLLVVGLVAALILAGLVAPRLLPPPSTESPVTVAPVDPAAVVAPVVAPRFSTAAAYERELARLRELNTSGDPILDAAAPRIRTAAEHERELARLRELNTSGDPILDNGYLPQRLPARQSGPF